MEHTHRFYAIPRRVALGYVGFSLLYIYLSDYLLKTIQTEGDIISQLQSAKGTAFVCITGILLYFLIRKYSNIINRFYSKLLEEKKNAFEAVKRSEEKYWAVFNFSPIPMWIYDIDNLCFLLVNEAACRKYGYTLEEFSQMTILDIRPAEESGKILEAVKIAVGSNHKAWHEPFTHITKGGRKLSVQINSTEIQFESRNARLVTATDITEKIDYEIRLQEANERLTSASKIAKLGYWSRDLRTSKIYWSDTLFEIFEQNSDNFELTPENVKQQFHSEEQEHLDHNSEQQFKDHTVSEFERRIVTGSGRQKWILERISLLKDGKNQPILLEGVALDITERKLAQQAIAISNERFNMVAQAVAEAIVDWNIQTGEVYWSDSFKKLFGHEPITNDLALWARNIHPDDTLRLTHHLTEAIRDRNTLRFFEEFRYIKANGETAYVEHRGIFTRDANGRAIRAVGAMTDVTRLKAKMVDIEKQNTQLREIAWIQSHVIRSPLATLMGLVELLKNRSEYEIDIDEVSDAIIVSADKLDIVIRDIVAKSEANGTRDM